MKYTIRKESMEYNFDVQYILEDENGDILLKMKGDRLRELYKFYTKNIQQAKDVLNSTHREPHVPKEAIDYFVEETYNS
jgi:hypothetical protein